MHTEGIVFPNEEVEWGLMIVMYPYITGIVAGTFIVSVLYHLFKKETLKPVGRLSLLASLSFLAFATMPLLLHLGHPERSFLIMIRPNLYSAMSGFGYIYSCFMGLLLVLIWLVYRPFIVDRSNNAATKFGRLFYKTIALGVCEMPEESRRIDEKLIAIVAGVGIPLACILTGYVGFIFGAVKANACWSSPMTPIIFLASAVMCGTAAMILIYFATGLLRRQPADVACVKTLVGYLWGFLLIGGTLELVELLTRWYERREEWEMFHRLAFEKLPLSCIWGQYVIGIGASFVILGAAVLVPMKPRVRHWLAGIGSMIVLLQVFCMRWNVVIGGQLLSKTGRGFHEYHAEWGGKEGILAAIVVFIAPFILLCVLYRVLPPYEKAVED